LVFISELRTQDSELKQRGADLGQKVHPKGFRLGITGTWDSRWFAGRKRDYGKRVMEDFAIRNLLQKELQGGGVSKIVIERYTRKVNVTIFTARPGIVIGKKGSNIDALVNKIKKLTSISKHDIRIDIEEIHRPELDAQLVAANVVGQLERRMPFRRVMKQTVANSMRMGALGIKVMCSGRLGGAEIARTEWTRDGRVPLHTLRARVDYGLAEASTKYGRIGVKVWIFLGEDLPEEKKYVIPQIKVLEEKGEAAAAAPKTKDAAPAEK